MSTSTVILSKRRNMNVLIVVSLMALTVSGISLAEATGDERTSNSRHIVQGGRSAPVLTSQSADRHAPLMTSGTRKTGNTRPVSGKPGSESSTAQSIRDDFWFFDADVILFNDEDDDGFYHGIDLLFDADTIYSAAEVYAVVYLSLDLGPWNEYAATEDFWIFGASGDDEYVIVTELMSGYPTGDYDLLIELFDAVDGSFLASFGPVDSAELEFLPLEDFDRDKPFVETRVTVSHGGGGSADAWTIAFLLLLLVASAAKKIWRRRNDELIRIDAPSSWSHFRLHTREPFSD